MIHIQGSLRKMKSVLDTPVQYTLYMNENVLPLNPLLGKQFQFMFTGKIFCIQCGRKTSKSFQQGYCFPCYRRLLECNMCMIHPERCQVEKGACPKDDWAHAHCHAAHIVYLANSSGVKVGITRHTQIPTRWIDQGAIQALPIFKVANRYQAGIVEVAFKQYVNDKTNWRKMLRGDVEGVDLLAVRQQLLSDVSGDIEQIKKQFNPEDIASLFENPIELNYPVSIVLEKIQSLSFDKTPTITGELLGIKGQYLILDSGVVNVRKFGGYEVSCEVK